ncbi:superoxide dismutase [Fe] [Helicobacter ailurogastricus]|uniref:Superoxide dismutase n=1 Tax=Helicobacter ailurogastricus TaxID=1578720 RepID=A0A0K2XEC3_9HELI|nr:superoxide dismutase [Fe] [Helicobacter ailurogastricus]CRF40701.1 Superoxide dismutase [Fe] [Helicobacter ailurogastricus]CRF43094.1 Superoxide dismutase [Fe] [Helicobacter ailurogastricus]CRF44323.1 Superoxide dismutase [Fe] [Helicobacter ailurogastricus]GMB89400.1 Superoxide dismutase SodB [Helicobacter ailurogastricus]GMB90963.1 Superoxide dismutase SodB [Helicobacter ailurogastricus]
MFVLRELPYSKDSMGDFLSPTAFDYHHGKHHQAYVNNLNNLIKDTEFKDSCLFTILTKSSGGVFNNAAQIYNHDFYWDCLSPKATEMSAELKEALEHDYGSLGGFKEAFIKSATTLFGSGWNWAVYNPANHKIEIVQTSNAHTPVTEHKVPLLVVDVWEHAYYIDHKNARPVYLEKFYEHINWAFVSACLEWAKKEGLGSVDYYINQIVHKKA